MLKNFTKYPYEIGCIKLPSMDFLGAKLHKINIFSQVQDLLYAPLLGECPSSNCLPGPLIGKGNHRLLFGVWIAHHKNPLKLCSDYFKYGYILFIFVVFRLLFFVLCTYMTSFRTSWHCLYYPVIGKNKTKTKNSRKNSLKIAKVSKNISWGTFEFLSPYVPVFLSLINHLLKEAKIIIIVIEEDQHHTVQAGMNKHCLLLYNYSYK